MNSPRMHPFRGAVWAALFLPVGLFGQSTSSSSVTDPDEPIALSPFMVNTNADQGYYATNSVSGTRTRTELINLPMSMTVLTDEFITDIGARDLIDVVQYASGVTIGAGQATNDGDNTSFTLRGQVGFVPMRNGFRRLRVASAANIDRVEILKGPASLLYGQLNPGGNVNYITKRPLPNQRIAKFTAQVGSYELYRGIADINVPIAPQTLALRLVGSYEDSQSIVARYHNITHLLNPSLTWWIRPETTLTVEVERTTRNIGGFKSGLPFHPTLSFEDQNYPIDRTWNTHSSQDYSDTTMTAYTAELVHRFNRNLTFRANLTKAIWYEEVKQTGGNITLGGPNLEILYPANKTNASTLDDLGNRGVGYEKRGSWDEWKQYELVNNFTWGGVEVQNLAGFQYETLEFRRQLGTTQITPNPPVQWNVRDPSTWIVTNMNESDTAPSLSSNAFSTNVTKSYYFVNQLSFMEGRLRTLAGLRYDDLRVFRYNRLAVPERSESKAEPAKIPQAGVLLKVTDGISVYASYSESFLPVFSTGRRPDGTFFAPGPQSGKGYDLGVKWELAEGRFAGNAAVYRVDNTDIIRSLPPVTIVGPNGTETFAPFEQSGTDRSEGFELDLRLRPSPKTQVMAAYAYTEAWVVSDTAARANINGQVYFTRTGHWLQNAPKHSASFWARHEFGALGGFKKVWLMGGGNYVSKRVATETYNIINGVPTPPPTMRGYHVANLAIGGQATLLGRDYDVSLHVNNLFDKVYLENRYHFGRPRMFVLSVTGRF